MNNNQEDKTTRGIQCPICININPGYKGEQPLIVLTSCGHAYCDDCLTKYIDHKITNGYSPNVVPCPTCKKAFNSQSENYKLRIFASFQNAPPNDSSVVINQEETVATIVTSMKNDLKKMMIKLIFALHDVRNENAISSNEIILRNRVAIQIITNQLTRMWSHNICDTDQEHWNNLIEYTEQKASFFNGCVVIRKDSFILVAFMLVNELIRNNHVYELGDSCINWITKTEFSTIIKTELCHTTAPQEILLTYFSQLRSRCSHDDCSQFVKEWKNLWLNIFVVNIGVFGIDQYNTSNMFKPLCLLVWLIMDCLKRNNINVEYFLKNDDYVNAIMFPINLYLQVSMNKNIAISDSFKTFMLKLIVTSNEENDENAETHTLSSNNNKVQVALLKIMIKLQEMDEELFQRLVTTPICNSQMAKFKRCCLELTHTVQIIRDCGKKKWIQLIESFYLSDINQCLRNRHRSKIAELVKNLTYIDGTTYTYLIDNVDNFENWRKEELMRLLLQLSEVSDGVSTLLCGGKRDHDNMEEVVVSSNVVEFLPTIPRKRGRPRKVQTSSSGFSSSVVTTNQRIESNSEDV